MKHKALEYYFGKDGFYWIRIFGWGIHLKDMTRNRLYFSERMGYNGVKIGKWIIKFLKPRKG